MRVRKSLCLLGHSNRQRLSPISITQRARYSQQPSNEPSTDLSKETSESVNAFDTSRLKTFDASTLLLDLDNPESQHVRRYEDSIKLEADEEETSQHRPNLIKKHISSPSFMKNTGWWEAPATADIYKARNIDYLNLALRGPSTFDEFESQNLFPAWVDKSTLFKSSFREVVTELQSVSHIASSSQWNFDANNTVSALQKLNECKHTEHLRRVIESILDADGGCDFLVRHSDVIVKVLVRCSSDGTRSVPLLPGTYSDKIVMFLNDITERLGHKGYDMGKELCAAGLFFSAKARNISGLKHYIDAAHREASNPSGDLKLEMFSPLNALNHITDLLETKPYSISNSERVGRWIERSDILAILTGWRRAGRPTRLEYNSKSLQKWELEIRQPCFATLIKDNHKLYVAYILSLGKINAVESIWDEWTHRESTTGPSRYMDKIERDDIFIDAFLTAEAPSRALWVLESSRRERRRAGIVPLSRSDEIRAMCARQIHMDPQIMKDLREELLERYES